MKKEIPQRLAKRGWVYGKDADCAYLNFVADSGLRYSQQATIAHPFGELKVIFDFDPDSDRLVGIEFIDCGAWMPEEMVGDPITPDDAFVHRGEDQ